MNLKDKIVWANEKVNVFTNQMVIYGEYILAGYSYIDDGRSSNMLLKVDKNFNLLEEELLSEGNQSFYRMIEFKDKLYMSETNNGISDDGEPNGGKSILVYDLKTKNKESIQLTYSYPMELYIDEQNENLIVRHYELYVKDHAWTVYSLKNKQETFIKFPKYKEIESEQYVRPATFQQKNGYYYFLYFDQLTKYNVLTQDRIELSLTEFGLDDPHTLIITK